MILKRSFLDNLTAMGALDKCAASGKIPFGEAYRVGRLHERVQKEVKITRDLWFKLLKKHAVLGEDLVPVLENGKPKFETPEKEKLHDEAFVAMMEQEFEEKVLPITRAALKDVGLTPLEWVALDPILEKPPESEFVMD